MNRKDLTQGGILGNIMTFSLPYMFAYFLQILYGLADLFVIGQFCNVDSTTAVSNGAQVMYLITCVVIGLAMGTTVCLGRAVGAKDGRRAARIIGNTATMFLMLSVVLASALLILRSHIVGWIDTPVEAVGATRDYLTICFIGIPFIMAYNIIASIFRGLGDSRSPMYFVAIACVVNIILDYVFIGGCGLGAKGAALGTTLSQAFSVAVALLSIRKQRRKVVSAEDVVSSDANSSDNISSADASSATMDAALAVCRDDFKPQGAIIKNILKIGFPIAMQDGFIQIAFIIITVIANGRGLYDAAAVGIVEKFIGLIFIVPSAMLSTVSAISSQNIGARNLLRAQGTLWRAMTITTSYGVAVALLMQWIPDVAVRLFTDDAQVIGLGAEYLRGYVWDCIFAGIHFCFSGFFTACGYSIISFCHNFVSIMMARVPLVYLASEMYPDTLYPMGLATCLGSVLSCVICVVAYPWVRRKVMAAIGKA